MENTFFKYTDLSDFINRTQVVIATPENYAVIIIKYMEDVPLTLPGFRADPNLSDFAIKEEGYKYWMAFENNIKQGKKPGLVSYKFDPENNPLDKLTSGIIKTHYPLDIGDIDFPVSEKYRNAIKNGMKPVSYVNIMKAETGEESTLKNPLMPEDCFKLRDCPACKQITAQEQKLYNPDDPGAGLVWHCTKCKENIDLV